MSKLIRDAVATIKAVVDSLDLEVVVTHKPFVGQTSAWGTTDIHAAFGTGVPYDAIVEQQQRWRTLPDGNPVFTMASILILRPMPDVASATARKNPIDPRDI